MSSLSVLDNIENLERYERSVTFFDDPERSGTFQTVLLKLCFLGEKSIKSDLQRTVSERSGTFVFIDRERSGPIWGRSAMIYCIRDANLRWGISQK